MIAQFEATQPFFFFQINGDYSVHMSVQAIFVNDGGLKNDIWRDLTVTPCDEVAHDTWMHQGVETFQGLLVREYDTGNKALVGTAVGSNDVGIQGVADVLQE